MDQVCKHAVCGRLKTGFLLGGVVVLSVCVLLPLLKARDEGNKPGAQGERLAEQAFAKTGLAGQALDVNLGPLRYLCPPDGEPVEFEANPSPLVTPFKDPLFVP